MHPSNHPPAQAAAYSEHDRQLLEHLRRHRQAHRRTSDLPHHPSTPSAPSMGQRLADKVAAAVGSWRFITLQSLLITGWICWNIWSGQSQWDPYPFILLNLVLSFQAAYTAPAIMMSQNRQAEIDRANANSDYEVNIKAELEIELLHQKIDLLREQEIRDLSEAVRQLTQLVHSLQKI